MIITDCLGKPLRANGVPFKMPFASNGKPGIRPLNRLQARSMDASINWVPLFFKRIDSESTTTRF